MYDEQGNTLKEVIIKSTYIGMPKNVVHLVDIPIQI